jgi:hypothetical protein
VARIRTIKPEFWTHEDLSALPEPTHMLAAALLNHADDEGYFNANPGLVKAACSPLREPSVSIQDSLKLLSEIGFITLLIGENGKRYGRVNSFDLHQRVNRPTPSKIKALGVRADSSVATHTQLTEGSPPERNREQGTGNREIGSLRSPSSKTGEPVPDPPAPADLNSKKVERLRQIAEEARLAFNAALGKPVGLLPRVRLLTPDRVAQVKRCLTVARAICQEQYGAPLITPRFWADYFAVASEDDFHAGRQVGGLGHENWTPDFEYLTKPAVMSKLFDRAMADEPDTGAADQGSAAA